MAANPTLLCIHRDPARLKVLRENGYELLTAGNGREGLRLFRSRPVDGIVLEYNLGLLDGAFIASGIKQVRPTIPIVMVAEHAELPDGALQAVDVLVSTSDKVSATGPSSSDHTCTEFYAGFSDLPHSRQQGLWRAVISPQNGHILCDMKRASSGLADADILANQSLSLLLKRSRKR